MFTGIVEALGRVRSVKRRALEIEAAAGMARRFKKGSSLSVNGVCLTVSQNRGRRILFDLSGETVRRTALGRLRAGDAVNLERPLRFGARIGGHFVLGHVDGRGRVLRIRKRAAERSFLVSFPKNLGSYLFQKGSVAVDGVSLTIGKVQKGAFWVHCVPHTLRSTCLGRYRVGSAVNLEADVLAKQAPRLKRWRQSVDKFF